MSKIIKAYHGVKTFYTNVSRLTKNKNNKSLHPDQQKHTYLPAAWKSILALSNFKASHVFLNLMLHIYNMQSLFQLTTELTYWDTHDALTYF